jgi:hypothetical protein
MNNFNESLSIVELEERHEMSALVLNVDTDSCRCCGDNKCGDFKELYK